MTQLLGMAGRDADIAPDDEHVSSELPSPCSTTFDFAIGSGAISELPAAILAAEVLKKGDFCEKKCADTDPFLVTWDGPNDPKNPMNISYTRKCIMTFISGSMAFSAAFSSSGPSGSLAGTQRDLHMSDVQGIAILSCYIAGYLIGPMLWGPLSEVYGRRRPFIVSFSGFTICQVASAFSPNAACMLILRFLTGVLAVCPYTVSGALITDIWKHRARGNAMMWFILAPFLGPSIGPIVAGYLYEAGLDWRWTFWVMSMLSGSLLLSVIFFVQETYAPLLLKRKAVALRKLTGDQRYYAPLETMRFSFWELIVRVIGRPMRMFFTEPMLAATAGYMLFTNGCVYLYFEAYPVIFTDGHHFGPGLSSLMYIPISIGGGFALALFAWCFEPAYLRKMDKFAPNPVPPEERLRMAIWGGPFFAISFFWLGWTSSPSISFWAPMMSGIVTGTSILMVFMSLTNYVIDVYLPLAASVLATNSIIRSISGFGFPLFARAMFIEMGPQWACTLLGCIAAFCSAIPFVLFRAGPWLRSKSKYTPTL